MGYGNDSLLRGSPWKVIQEIFDEMVPQAMNHPMVGGRTLFTGLDTS
jgi:hypothetical protein